jgi:signal transduction histidine kinase
MSVIAKNGPDQELTHEIAELVHFIRTPLASIKIGGDILKEVLPLLINAYKENIQLNQKNHDVVSSVKLDKLDSIINNILIEANRISEHTLKLERHLYQSRGK